MIRIKLGLYIYSVILSLIFLSGCVSLQYGQKESPPQAAAIYHSGIYHTVEAGQTLWMISRMYGINLEELVKINNISDVTGIEIGQQIFIPEGYKMPSGNTDRPLEDFIWPLKGRLVGKFQEIYDNMVNKGINIEPNLGLDVLASRSGKVVFYNNDFKGFGKTVIIEHADDFMTIYAGLQEVFIKVGDMVGRGAVIARVSLSGQEKNSYLHFEIRKGPLPQNPIFYLPS